MDYTLLILLVALVTILALLIKAWLAHTLVPPLVGWLLLGLGARALDQHIGFLSENSLHVFHFLGQVGLFALLFRVGLESRLAGLLAQLRRASLVWLSNVAFTGLAGYAVGVWLLGLGPGPSLILAVAFTATSVGVTVPVWQEAGRLDTANGALLVDVAELDDISAVVFMALLFAVLPSLGPGRAAPDAWSLASLTFWFLVKLCAFAAFCTVFSTLAEERLTRYFRRLEKPPEPMLMVVGVALLIAALAGLLGFSLAIGAFFAGLVFSRDPESMKLDTSFLPLHDFFAPFFFISIGLDLEPAAMSSGLGLGLVLLAVAAGSKIVGNALPLLAGGGPAVATLMGVSMVPRAEIAMVVMQRGLALGPWAVPPELYAAMVVVCLLTSTLSPPAVRLMLQRGKSV